MILKVSHMSRPDLFYLNLPNSISKLDTFSNVWGLPNVKLHPPSTTSTRDVGSLQCLEQPFFLAFSICGEEGYKLGIFVEKLATNTFIEELFFKLN